jgi:hypothetical protein
MKAKYANDVQGGSSMKMQEVRAKAKSMGVNSFGKTKLDLIKEIQRKEGYSDCYGTAVNGSCDQTECCFRDSCMGAEKDGKKRNRNT